MTSRDDLFISTTFNKIPNEWILDKAFDHLSVVELWSWLLGLGESPCSALHQYIEHKIVKKDALAFSDQSPRLTVFLSGRAAIAGKSLHANLLKRLFAKFDLRQVVTLRVSQFTPYNLIALTPYLLHLQYLSLCHASEEHTDTLISHFQALRDAEIRLQTLHIDGPGFGNGYMGYLNKIWEIFPAIRVTRFTGMPLVSKLAFSLQFPGDLQGFEISHRLPDSEPIGSKNLHVPNISYAELHKLFGSFLSSQNFQFLHVDFIDEAPSYEQGMMVGRKLVHGSSEQEINQEPPNLRRFRYKIRA
ncbi:hypothetical protein EYR41_006100 [Orbilia oligospora]|uniref:Uncharacterized protein n=1 Tax=Orbilia oligospora TaxID=2813651 RepID=A0A8H2E027_ORBOL|nr:hypothetical protein EYR41_006100 [Orbilia oligospora]